MKIKKVYVINVRNLYYGTFFKLINKLLIADLFSSHLV